MKSIEATIVVPVYNGEEHLDRLIEAVFAQQATVGYELLIILTESTDDSEVIIRSALERHSNLRLHTIKKSEFSHGKTRNLGVKMAQGHYVIMLTQDAVPIGTDWLERTLAPFKLNEKVVGLFGRQVPRPHCPPIIKRDMLSIFSRFGPNDGITLYAKSFALSDDAAVRDFLYFYSDAFSALDKKHYPVPYAAVDYAEDQIFGKRIIEDGNIKAYAGNAVVEHSNDMGLWEYRRRIREEFFALRAIGKDLSPVSTYLMLRLIIVGVARDWLFTIRDKDYGRKIKLYYLVTVPFFSYFRFSAIRQASRHRQRPSAKQKAK